MLYQFNCCRLSQIFIGLPLATAILALTPPVFAAEPPSKQFIKKDIPIVWILDEWHKKHPQVPLYACICTKADCNSSQSWPFRKFTIGGVLPALGLFNKSSVEKIGFVCGQVDPKDIKGIGG